MSLSVGLPPFFLQVCSDGICNWVLFLPFSSLSNL